MNKIKKGVDMSQFCGYHRRVCIRLVSPM